MLSEFSSIRFLIWGKPPKNIAISPISLLESSEIGPLPPFENGGFQVFPGSTSAADLVLIQ